MPSRKQSREDGWDSLSVVLEKTTAKQGFGIAISGGKDNPHFKTGDIAVIVSDIVKGSPADGRLRIGDKLLSVNERNVDGGTHHQAVEALKAAGMQARMEVKRASGSKSHANESKDSPLMDASDSDRGRSRKKPREMEQESGERKSKSSRSRSRQKEGEGEGGEKPKRSRSKSRDKSEDSEKPKRSHSRNRENGEDKPRRSHSKSRENGEDKPKRSRSKNREDGDDKPRRSRSKNREDGDEKPRSRSSHRSKSRSRDDLTRSKSKESLHQKKSKTNDIETVTVVLERGDTGYGFSLGQQIFVKDLAKNSPAAKAENLEKGDVVHEINGIPLENMKISECIEIIRAATEQVTLTVIKKSTHPNDDCNNKQSVPTRPNDGPQIEKVKPRKLSSDDKPVKEMIVKERTPSPSIHEEQNETKDSWADATPKKRFEAELNQDVEDMETKISRLDPQKKIERRLSQMPNAKMISFHKTGSVGIQVAGGNSVGIFVAAIRPDSAAAEEGLKPGDQIIMCNEIDFEEITREEAVLILLALPDDVSLVVESRKQTFEQIKKELGDNFFIRVNFDHLDRANANELIFRKGEIFNVRDTMYQGLIGYWQAQRVGKNAQMLERGVLPNKSRAEQLAIAQKMEDRQAHLPGRSKVKRKSSIGTLKKQKFMSQDRLDESSFAEGVLIPAYERVVLKVADFMRPVVVLGALADLCRLKLLEDMPDRFDIPTPSTYDQNLGDAIKVSEIRNVITKNKHCLLDITPEGIETLMYAQLCPIVVLLKSPSRGAVKEMRQSLVRELQSSPTSSLKSDPLLAKQVKRVFSNAKKLEEFYPHIFTAKINTHIAGGNVLSREFYHKLKEVIFTQQAQSAWMPEEKPDEMLDDMVFHPPNYMSYLSGADSDTEGESMTSSPILARKHYEEDETPSTSPVEESAPVERKYYKCPRGRRHSSEREDSPERRREKSRAKVAKDRSPAPLPDQLAFTDRDHFDAANREQLAERAFDDDPYNVPEERRSDYNENTQKSAIYDDGNTQRRPIYDDENTQRRPIYDDENTQRRPIYDDENTQRRPIYDDENTQRRPIYDDENTQRRPIYDDENTQRRPIYDDENTQRRPIYDDENTQRRPIYDDENTQSYYRHPPATDNYYKNPSMEHRTREQARRNESPNNFYRNSTDDRYDDFKNNDGYPETRRGNDIHNSYYNRPDNDSRSGGRYMVEEQISAKISTNVYREPDADQVDVPVLRDPKYSLPNPIPDSPPSRRPPEVKAKPVNAIRVLPNELKNEFSMEEKRRSLKKIEDGPKDDLPPYRPPPVKEDLPTKTLSLQERMSKFQNKVVTNHSNTTRDESPPPRPSAPRNYIIDSRNRNSPRNDLYAKNDYKPTAQFAQVQRIAPTSNVKPYATIDFAPKSKPTVPSGYDYVKSQQVPTTNLDYDYPSTEPHYRNPRNDPYSVPTRSYKQNEDYPPYDMNNDRRKQPDESEPRVIATARGWFDHRGGLLESPETNVSIYIPAGALPANRQQEVYFKVCQDSKHMPPLDSSSGETLLSPLVMCGPHGLQFKKPIELRLPHKGASSEGMAFSLKSSDSPIGEHHGHWKNVKLGGKDLDSGRAYQVTEDTVSVLVDHF